MQYPYKSDVLARLGVRSWINARNWSSDIGGNILADEVLKAMREVSLTFVDMHELIHKADERIAELCNAEEAHITTGASGAIQLAVAGCMAGEDYGKWIRLPDSSGMKNQVLLARGHFIHYTPQWKASGAHIIEYGIAGTLRSSLKEMEAKITDETCCISYTFSYNNVPRGRQPFAEVVELGKKYEIPVVVDAASELPPVANLYKFLDLGADIVCFSGGKAIGGPNNCGMMVGRNRGASIIKAIRQHSFPHAGWGRGHKISKEQIAGFVTALELFVERGDSWYEEQYKTAQRICSELNAIENLEVQLMPNNALFHEHPEMPKVPRVLMKWMKENFGSAEDLDRFMEKDDPPIFLRNVHYSEYYTNKEWRLIDTFFLRPEEIGIVIDRLKKYFS